MNVMNLAVNPEVRNPLIQDVLITGGTGFVGRSLVDAIQVERPHWVLTTSSRKKYGIGTRRHLEWDCTGDVIPDVSFNTLIHAATTASAAMNANRPREMFWSIVRGMENVLKLAERQNEPPTILFTSSGAVYGELPSNLDRFPEGFRIAASTTEIKSAYAEGKRAAEFLLSEATQRGVCKGIIARLFAFSGVHLPLDRHFAIGNFVRDVVDREEIVISGTGSVIRSYLDGTDMARWLLAAINNGSQDFIFHVGSDEAISIIELSELVCARAHRLLGSKPAIRIKGTPLPTDGQDRYVPEITRTMKSLGVSKTVTLSSSIDSMILNYVNQQSSV